MKKKTENGLQKSSSKTGIANIPIEKGLATTNNRLVIEIMSRCNLESDEDRVLFAEALDHFSVTQSELFEGFFSAYADPMVPQTGIEFKHIMKHISMKRYLLGTDKQTQTGTKQIKEFNAEEYLASN